MKSEHLTFSAMVELAENKLTTGEEAASRAHLAGCSPCANDLQRIEAVLRAMQNDHSIDAPRDLLAYAKNLFAQRAEGREPSLLKKIIAVLSFDSLNPEHAFGVRSGAAAGRQLLYSAGEADIDVRIAEAGADRWIVAGQVLGENCAGGEVRLEGTSGTTSRALNDLCEFTLPAVASGTYKLVLRLRDVEVEAEISV